MESRAGKKKQISEKRTVPRYVNVNYMREITFAYFYNDLHHFLSSSFSRYPSSRTWHAIHPTEFHNARSQPDRRSLAKFWSSADDRWVRHRHCHDIPCLSSICLIFIHLKLAPWKRTRKRKERNLTKESMNRWKREKNWSWII